MKRDYETDEKNEINENVIGFVYFVLFVYFVIPLRLNFYGRSYSNTFTHIHNSKPDN